MGLTFWTVWTGWPVDGAGPRGRAQSPSWSGRQTPSSVASSGWGEGRPAVSAL